MSFLDRNGTLGSDEKIHLITEVKLRNFFSYNLTRNNCIYSNFIVLLRVRAGQAICAGLTQEHLRDDK